jgi:hypothetical protein
MRSTGRQPDERFSSRWVKVCRYRSECASPLIDLGSIPGRPIPPSENQEKP